MQEQVYILFLNGSNEVISWRCLNTGTCDKTIFDIKLALACALNCMANKIIIAHNHPSGLLKPSGSDLMITERLASGCEIIGLKLEDHLIIDRYNYFSFADHGIIEN